jgi:transmembrane sensor
MMTRPDSVSGGCSITEQAAAWRLTLGAHDPRKVPEFWQWVTRSPEHVREALVVGLLNQALQELGPQSGDLELDVPHASGLDGAEQPKTGLPMGAQKARVSRWLASAAALAACVSFVLVAAWWIRGPNQKRLVTEYSTGVGELRTLRFHDGSTITLDAQSHLHVQLSSGERYFELNGQALFNVAHDPKRPFRVHTAAATVEALGTEFNVRTQRLTTVAVLDGAVRLYAEQATPSAQLGAGEAASMDSHGAITDRTRVDRETVTAWEQRRLVFSRVPLEEIVQEFNRYNRKGFLHVEGRAAQLKFGGVFDANDPGPLLLVLERNPTIVVERRGNDVVIRDKR